MDHIAEGDVPFMAIGGAVVYGLSPTNGLSENQQPHIEENQQDIESLFNRSNGLHATNEGDTVGANEVDSECIVPGNNNQEEISSDDQDRSGRRQIKKKRLHRLASHQTQTLEAFFSVCAHPDEKQRMQLSEKAGLEPQQVKFWFQNKRTQVKTLSEREENYRLKVENDILKNENLRLKEAQKTTVCTRCGELSALNQTEQSRLRDQNEWFKQEIARLYASTSTPTETPLISHTVHHASQPESLAQNVLARHTDTEAIIELAKKAMQELIILAESRGPLWLRMPGSSLETLNKVEYAQTFVGRSGPKIIGLKTEATRANGVGMLDSKNIADFLMDADSYETFFPGIVSKARTTKVYCWPLEASYDGAMQLMTLEMVFPSPMVPIRKCAFVRYCKQPDEGTVVIVDVSLGESDDPVLRCHKMPSGIIIQSMPHNSCKITWIEHVQADDRGVHDLYKPCLGGLAFGARRWMTSMARQCARMKDVFHVSSDSTIVSSNGRKNMMKLADNMVISYCSSVVASPAHFWSILRGAGTEQDIRVTYKRNADNLSTAVVCATASFWLPLPLKKTFELLKNNILRSKWDVLVNGGTIKDEIQVASGIGSADSVSILHVKHGGEGNKGTIMILQNSWYDVSGSFLIYAPIDTTVMNMVLDGGEPGEISLFPSGLAILPDGGAAQNGSGLADMAEIGGTLMTVAFQILMKIAPGSDLSPRSASSVIKLMSENCEKIKGVLLTCSNMPRKERK